ncbi:MAG: DUF4276 family protein [Nannocystaceae bacterium]
MNLVFLLEELSAKDLLQGLLPRLLCPSVTLHFLVFEGKQDLERQLVRKLRGWGRPSSAFVVLRDQDAGDCVDVKKGLLAKVDESGRDNTIVRIACRDLEAWIVGDWASVARAFKRPQLAELSNKKAFRNPDFVVRPVEALRKQLPEYQKRDGARQLGRLLNPQTNKSRSFQVFCAGVRRGRGSSRCST